MKISAMLAPLIAGLVVLLSGKLARGAPLEILPSAESYTGVIRIPHADGLQENGYALGYSNSISDFRSPAKQTNFYAILNIAPRVELYARLAQAFAANYRGKNDYLFRDLSAGLKITLLKDSTWFPSLAYGEQDLGGGAQFFSQRYLVASKSLFGRFRGTLGFGFLDTAANKGVFGGLEVRALPFMDALAEYSDKSFRFGLRSIVSPRRLWFLPRELPDIVVSTSYSKQQQFIAAVSAYQPAGNVHPAVAHELLPAYDIEALTHIDVSADVECETIAAKLGDLGFENVQVRRYQKGDAAVLHVALENRMYEVYPSDGMRVALALVAASVPGNHVYLILEELFGGQALMHVAAPIASLRHFADSGTREVLPLRYGRSVEADGAILRYTTAVRNASRFHSDLLLRPMLSKYVGTEFTYLDVRADLGLDYRVPLWRGGVFQGIGVLPGYGNGSLSYDGSAKLPSLLLHQYFPSFGGFHTKAALGRSPLASDGKIIADYHMAQLSVFHADVLPHVSYSIDSSVASGRSFSKAHYYGIGAAFVTIGRWQGKLHAGQYLFSDLGYGVQMSTSFDRAIFSLFGTRTELGSVAGAILTLPLGFRKEPFAPGFLRARLGTLQTSVATKILAPVNTLGTTAGRQIIDPLGYEEAITRRRLTQ